MKSLTLWKLYSKINLVLGILFPSCITLVHLYASIFSSVKQGQYCTLYNAVMRIKLFRLRKGIKKCFEHSASQEFAVNIYLIIVLPFHK